jgi:hypothetical protein
VRRLLALLAVLPVAAACGDARRPQLDHADAAGLIALAGRIATEGACAQANDIPKLHARAVALVNARRVPQALQEPLLSAMNALAAQSPVCLPSVPASSTTAPTITLPGPPRRHGHAPKPGPKPGHHGHGPGPGHGHHGHGGHR